MEAALQTVGVICFIGGLAVGFVIGCFTVLFKLREM